MDSHPRRDQPQPGRDDRDRVLIFDTTLRDGEQSPGASMGMEAKLELAAALADLGVDILEAGFPIASEGDHCNVPQREEDRMPSHFCCDIAIPDVLGTLRHVKLARGERQGSRGRGD